MFDWSSSKRNSTWEDRLKLWRFGFGLSRKWRRSPPPISPISSRFNRKIRNQSPQWFLPSSALSRSNLFCCGFFKVSHRFGQLWVGRRLSSFDSSSSAAAATTTTTATPLTTSSSRFFWKFNSIQFAEWLNFPSID